MEKHKCSVCGYESEDSDEFAAYLLKVTKRISEFFGHYKLCVCVVCFWKALGVEPKEAEIDFDPKVPVNPCDTLTRMKFESDAATQVDTMKKQEAVRHSVKSDLHGTKFFCGEKLIYTDTASNTNYSIKGCPGCGMDVETTGDNFNRIIKETNNGTYEPTLIPGCPAEEKKAEISKMYGIKIKIEDFIKTIEQFAKYRFNAKEAHEVYVEINSVVKEFSYTEFANRLGFAGTELGFKQYKRESQ